MAKTKVALQTRDADDGNVMTLAHWRACAAIATKYESEVDIAIFAVLRDMAGHTIEVLDARHKTPRQRYLASLKALKCETELRGYRFRGSWTEDEQGEIDVASHALRWAESLFAETLGDT
jgi:hypothetical protein